MNPAGPSGLAAPGPAAPPVDPDGALSEVLAAADAALGAGDLAEARERLAAARDLTRSGRTRALRGDVAWRQGVVAEALDLHAEAAGHFEAAADAFGLEGAHGDEAVARMRRAEAAFLSAGALDGLRAAREAVEAARRSGEVETLLSALALTGELHAELGAYEDAMVRFREVLRRAADAEAAHGLDLGALALRAGVGVVEARLALGEDDKAQAALAQLAGVRALADGARIEARLAAIEAILSTRDPTVRALDPEGGVLPPVVARAAALCRAARISVRLARMLLQIGQRVERSDGPDAALPWFMRAAEEAEALSERYRLAPVHFALARCFGALGRWVEADMAIVGALRRSEEAGDLEGLRLCTELGVHIAVAIEVPNLAVSRLVALARARGLGGDEVGRTRSLVAALEIARRFSFEDLRGLLEELMGALRETGGAHLAPAELDELARIMGAAGAWELAREAWELRAGLASLEGRRSEEARCLISAANEAFKGGEREEGERLMERARELGKVLGLREIKAWSARDSGEREEEPAGGERRTTVLVK